MKVQTLYQCELCKTQFAKEDDAISCEKSHVKPMNCKSIVNMKFHRGHGQRSAFGNEKNYPDWIEIKMEDNEVVRYRK